MSGWIATFLQRDPHELHSWYFVSVEWTSAFGKLPPIAMPAKFINGPLGNGLSFFLGQAQAQPLHDLPCPDQGVADAVREESPRVIAKLCSLFVLMSNEGITLRRFIG